MDKAQIKANIAYEQAMRRANLLAAAAEVSQNITRILDIDQLLPKTVDIICNAYNFYYAGVFLIDSAGAFAVLQAGRGEPGRIMMENHHKLAVGGNSMIGACTARNEARISLDVDTEKVWYPNPVLPDTRSEMALPLAIGDRVIGAVTVQSVEAAAFSAEDISSLQAMANQLAIALDNARQRRELEETHAELLQAKTYEAIATATGDAIHWIGNKAEPIGGTVHRIRQDVQLLTCALAQLFDQEPPLAATAVSAPGGTLPTGQISPEQLRNRPLAQLLQHEADIILKEAPGIAKAVEQLGQLTPEKLTRRLSIMSILDDLQIIDDSTRLIMKVKEDLIGPAREQAPRPTMVDDVLQDVIAGLNIPVGIVNVKTTGSLPLVLADPVQLNRVFSNLIQNAYEAMENQPTPQISLSLQANKDTVTIAVTDNGSGIAAEDMDKIWITFHTTKGIKGHAGLGLPACRLIVEQLGGSIAVSSTVGETTTFSVTLPIATIKERQEAPETNPAKILLIDDDDGWRSFAASTLSKARYTVAVSGSGYSYETPTNYDLIIVDAILSKTNATTVLQSLKDAGVINRVVAISSNPRVEQTKAQMLLGIRNALPKPYTPVSLLNEVVKLLSA